VPDNAWGEAGAWCMKSAAGPNTTGRLGSVVSARTSPGPSTQRTKPSRRISSSSGSVVISCVVKVRSSETVRRSLNFRQPICSGRAFPQALTAAPFLVQERADPLRRSRSFPFPGMERPSSEVQSIGVIVNAPLHSQLCRTENVEFIEAWLV